MRTRSIAVVCIAALASMCSLAAAAATYPEKPIRIVVPTAVGGPSDLCIRAVGESMTSTLGQSVVIENVTGATGNIGLQKVGGTPPDGYTLAQASAANT